MLIGELASKANVSVDTIRYYQREGLVVPEFVRESGYREFNAQAVETLRFIVRAKDLGFSLKQIRTLLQLTHNPDTRCGEVRGLAEDKLAEINAKIAALEGMKDELTTLLTECSDQSASVTQCPIVESLERKEDYQ